MYWTAVVVYDAESSIYARTRSGFGNILGWLGGMTRIDHAIFRGTGILSARK